MKALRRLGKFLIRRTPFRISLLIMVGIMVLYWGTLRKRLPTLQILENKAYDLRFQVRGSLPVQAPILICVIDERAIEKIGTWPWDRSKWAAFVENITKYQPKVVAFDMVFDKPDRSVNLRAIEDFHREYERLGLPAVPPMRTLSEELARDVKNLKEAVPGSPNTKTLLDKLEQVQAAAGRINQSLSSYSEASISYQTYLSQRQEQADTDRYFAAALKDAPGVVMGWFFYQYRFEVEQLEKKDFSADLASLGVSTLSPNFAGGNYTTLYRWATRMFGLRGNIPLLAQSIQHFGYFVAEPDRVDGTIRRSPLVAVFKSDDAPPSADNLHLFPSLSLAAVSIYLDLDPLVRVGPLGVEGITIKDHRVPTDESGRMLINYLGPQFTFPYYSVYDVISDFKDQLVKEGKKPIDPYQLYKDKIVLVGSTATGAHDVRISPWGSTPGVETHANVVHNILYDQTLIRPSWFAFFDYCLIIGLGILFGILLPRVSAIWGGVLAAVFFGAYALFNYLSFTRGHYSFTIIFPLAEIALAYVGVTLYRYATEEREKRFIKGAFGQYLSPDVIDQLVKDPSKLKLGGLRKELTAFFSDLQGFSTFSETLSPEELVALLNEYLTEMCDLILGYEGTIDKFEGDAIIAFFGAPIDQPDHARRACFTAIDIQKRMQELRRKWREQGKPELFMRIGLNTGPMVVGNMGSRQRMDYTMMGDAVNLASRLEGVNKQYATYTMISQFTYAEVKEDVEVRELDSIRVVGKKEPVMIYELLARKGELDPMQAKALSLFQRGRELYQQRQWAAAKAVFEEMLKLDPQDGPAQTYVARCEEYQLNPPAADWDGVFVMKHK